jgi:hypothetical protein
MSGRAPRRPRWKAAPPPGLRPKLKRDQVLDLGLVHLENVDAIACGDGTPEILWHHISGALTWQLVAKRLAEKEPERFGEALRVTSAALAAANDLVARYRRTGRVVFAGPELLMAREAVPWMDALAEVADQAVASWAADASEVAVNEMAQQVEQQRAA